MLPHSWKKVADGRDLDEKLAEAGIGGSNKVAPGCISKTATPTGASNFCQPHCKAGNYFKDKICLVFQRLFGKDNKPAIARGPLGLHLNSGLRSIR